MSPHHRRALTLTISLAALLYLGFVLFADRAAVFAALRRVELPVLAAIFGLSLLNYLLRFWRWQRYIAAFGHVLPWRRHWLYYLSLPWKNIRQNSLTTGCATGAAMSSGGCAGGLSGSISTSCWNFNPGCIR